MELYWLIGGIVLIILELVVPGAILMFLGGGALVVALLLWTGVLGHWMGAFTTWFVVSLALIIVFRSMVQRFSGGKSARESTDEYADAAGKIDHAFAVCIPQFRIRCVVGKLFVGTCRARCNVAFFECLQFFIAHFAILPGFRFESFT